MFKTAIKIRQRFRLTVVVLSFGLLLTAGACSSATATPQNVNGSFLTTNVAVSNSSVELTNNSVTNTNSSLTATATVAISGQGYAPSTATISIGQTVTWVNNDTSDHWPVIDAHSRDLNLSAYDSLGLAPGESFSFTFSKAGTWTFHDKLTADWSGTVVVQ